MAIENDQKIKEILTKGVEEVISRSHLEKKIKAGEKLRVKFGVDPTSADLHLGHSVPLRKLKEFQELGHRAIFLIGDFTARIGDPSGRAAGRRTLSGKEIQKNVRDYARQAAKILDIKKIEIRYNSEWYEKKGADFLMDLASRFTYARLIERDEFQRRIKRGSDINMLELIYPLLQGYDSVELKADLEIGGTDQKFNLLMGRRVQKKYGQPQQDVMTLPLLVGTDGASKMSKSYDNFIALREAPPKMYGKIMSIPDTIIWHYFKLLTDLPSEEIGKMRQEVYRAVLNPREIKAKLAFEVVKIYHGAKSAQAAQTEFDRVFKGKKVPLEIPGVSIKEESVSILDLLAKTGLAKSKAEAKRLILQGGVKIDGVLQSDWQKTVEIHEGQIIQAGKRRFAKIKTRDGPIS